MPPNYCPLTRGICRGTKMCDFWARVKLDKKSVSGKVATSLKLKGQLRKNKEKDVQKVRLTRDLQSRTSDYKVGREDSRKMIRPIQIAQVVNLISFE